LPVEYARRLCKSTSQEAASFLFAVTGQRPLQNLYKQSHKQQVLMDCHDQGTRSLIARAFDIGLDEAIVEDGKTCVDEEPTGSTAIQLCI
jgi:hypothetical protein